VIDTYTILEQTKHLSLLFVEDDEALRMRTAEILEDYFYHVDTAVDGIDALEKFKHYYSSQKTYYDLVISDLQMPRMDGIILTSELYLLRNDQPIIILSAHNETKYLLALINIGIAHFITKPIQYQNILDSLYKVCKKINIASNIIMSTSSFIFIGENLYWDSKKRTLIYNGVDVILTRYEILLMDLLASKLEKVCSVDEIIGHFYLNNIDVSSENLRGMMMRLRKKLPKNAISSIYGLGYRLSTF
jgi:DNA-binding response OmpR family regulator